MYPQDVPKVPLATTVFKAGDFPTATPSNVILQGCCECYPNEKLKAMRSSFSDFLKKLFLTDPQLKGTKYKLRWWGLHMEGAEIIQTHPLVHTISDVILDLTQFKSMVVGAGGSDLRLLINEGQIPAIMFGPDSGNGHGIDEFVDITSLIESLKILAITIINYCGIV
jgi:acetylornithine deacetylase